MSKHNRKKEDVSPGMSGVGLCLTARRSLFPTPAGKLTYISYSTREVRLSMKVAFMLV